MLDILGVDGLDQGFTVGVCFMNKESEFDYLRFLSRTIPTTIFARPTMASKEKPQASIHQPPCHPLLPRRPRSLHGLLRTCGACFSTESRLQLLPQIATKL
jgi:hypothetical protein